MEKRFTSILLTTAILLFIISVINTIKGNVEAASTGLIFAIINLLILNFISTGGALDEQANERESTKESNR